MKAAHTNNSAEAVTTPILRYHGSKFRLAPWIAGFFPEHRVYVEPFGGSAGVLLQKPRSTAEVYNDLDGEIVNVFRVLRDRNAAAELLRLCQLTPYAREEFGLAQQAAPDPIEQARRTLFRSWAGFGSASATRGRSGMRTVTNAGRYTPVARSWARVSELIPQFTARLAEVIIESRPAIKVMAQHDSEQTLHYVDPPYLPETRSKHSGGNYRHEMSLAEHEALLSCLNSLDGMVVLSGYDSPLYRAALPGWQQVAADTLGSGAQGSVSRTECLWINPAAQNCAPQMPLFAVDAAASDVAIGEAISWAGAKTDEPAGGRREDQR